MVKVTLAVAAAAAVLTTATLVAPAAAQVDMQGHHFDERDPAAFYREHPRGYGATVGVGAGGATIRSRDHAPPAPLRSKRRATKATR
jgi:hypothetical protein